MKSDNKKRMVFWGIIAIITIGLSIFGYILLQNGYGETGYVINKLKPIAETFNNLSDIERLKNTGVEISAKVENDTINMTYKTDNSKLKFKFNYQSNDKKEEFIVMEYNTRDNDIAKILIRYMIDAISVNDGYEEKQTNDYFTLESFIGADASKGANIKTKTGYTTATLNINYSVLDSIEIKEETNGSYITEDEAKESFTEIEINDFKSLKKDNITARVESNENNYIIYISDTDYTEELYNSTLSIIKVITNDETVNQFKTICTNFDGVDYIEETSKFMIEYDLEIEYEEFNKDFKILKITIKK